MSERISLAVNPAADDLGYAVVIPAYNEAPTILDVAARAVRQGHPVIVVDDGSSDGTPNAVASVPVRLLRNDCNIGKAGSLWRGMQYAMDLGVAGVVTLDGDGQHAPEDIPRLLRVARSFPDDLIIGARLKHREAAPRVRLAANRFADFWIGWAAGQRFEDSQSGFRVYPVSLLSRLAVKHDPSRGFVFESEVLIVAAQLGVSVRSVVIESVYPRSARPSHFRPVRDVSRIGRMVAWQLVRRGLYPVGLYRSLARPALRETAAVNEVS
jgi:glycosyltransferase involved in cell wall biosynthesis